MIKSNELDKRLCFCGSGRPFSECCRPIIEGERTASSAEQLMRSRYSAYAVENTDYLLKSWHPDTRPKTLDLGEGSLQWTGLTICACQDGQSGDRFGRVEFIARYVQHGTPGQVYEDSRFVYEQGQWWYLDGNLKSGLKVGRNDPCPCGSGKKYKKCCA